MKLGKKDFVLISQVFEITNSITINDSVKIAEKLVTSDKKVAYFIDSERNNVSVCYDMHVYDDKIDLKVWQENGVTERYYLSLLKGNNTDNILLIKNSEPQCVIELNEKVTSLKNGFPECLRKTSLEDVIVNVKTKKKRKEN